MHATYARAMLRLTGLAEPLLLLFKTGSFVALCLIRKVLTNALAVMHSLMRPGCSPELLRDLQIGHAATVMWGVLPSGASISAIQSGQEMASAYMQCKG